MRLCVFGASDELGGTESYLRNLYSVMDYNKIQFDFLLWHDTGILPFEDMVIQNGGRVLREYYRNGEKNQAEYISVKALFDMHPEWDGIYINVQRIHTAYRLLVEARKRGLPYRVIHAHTNYYTKVPSVKEKIYEFYFHITRRYVVTNYLACSNLAGKWMFGNSDFMVIPNAVDFCLFQMNERKRTYMREQYGIQPSTKVIGFCGRMVYQKNPEFMAEIFKEIQSKFTDSVLLMVGDGEKLSKVKEWLLNENLLSRTICTGAVSNVSEYMQMMDCFVLPSRFEGFGIVLLEAQAAGLRCYARAGKVPEETNVSGRVLFIDAYPRCEGVDTGFAIEDQKYASVWADSIIENGFEREEVMDIMERSAYTLASLKSRFESVFFGRGGVTDSLILRTPIFNILEMVA